MATIPSMFYRTFLGLPTPDAWHDATIMSISDLQKQLPAGSVQCELPNRTHLTLQFLGDFPTWMSPPSSEP